MDIYRICRTCLNESTTSLVSIHSSANEINDGDNFMNTDKIANILDYLTENKYVRNFIININDAFH